ncbi:unnamed protein product, partial [Prorocentrum cordatum]
MSSARSVRVDHAVAGYVHLRADQLNSSRGNDLSSTGRKQRGTAPGVADDWPQFNFSAAREAEAARILAANGLRPSADGREGNYVVYHWRSEAIDVNYTFCAQELLSHIKAQQNESGKRLVLVSDMPFNASVLPALWATTTAAKIGLQPTFPAARDMLMEAGFTKIEMMAQNAGYDLKSVPTAYISIWDAIIARGGEKLTLCRAEECTRCSRTRSKFLSLIRHRHFVGKLVVSLVLRKRRVAREGDMVESILLQVPAAPQAASAASEKALQKNPFQVVLGASSDEVAPEVPRPRSSPGGAGTVVLGADKTEWTTNNQTHGDANFEAALAVEERPRPAPGGATTISLGGAVFEPVAPSPRDPPGGAASLVLGSEGADWGTDSRAVGAAGFEA